MKKCSSIVWKFFDRIEEDKRCVAVLCKLCDTQYKYFGNTTNLRVHLANRHPIQWELGKNGTLVNNKIQIVDAETSSSPKRRRYKRVQDENVDVLETSDNEDNEATINLVRQLHADQNSDEEWLEEDPYQISHFETYEPKQKHKRMKYKKVKREVVSPTGLPGYYTAPTTETQKSYIFEDQTRKDEYALFGDYIGNKLRKFKNARTRGNLQQLITTLLWQAEYGMYDSAESVKRVLSFNVQENDQSTTEFEPQMQVHAEDIVIHRDSINHSNDSEVTIIETEADS